MGLRPTQLMKKAFCRSHSPMEASPSPLSSRPERTQISYLAALATATYAAFPRERRMNIANATNFDRKSGGA